MKSALERNKEYSERYIQSIENPKVPEHIKNLIKNNKIISIADLGCGDGALIHALKKEFQKVKVTGIDISPRRINALRSKFPKDKFYCKDVCNTNLKKNSFDFIISSQVIEHVEDDKKLVKEIGRLLKKKGFVVIDSVIKKSFSIYKYRNKGKFVLDPTHEREYKNQKEFLDLFRADFKLIKSWVIPVKRKFLSFEIKIPGYYLVYGIWKKRK